MSIITALDSKLEDLYRRGYRKMVRVMRVRWGVDAFRESGISRHKGTEAQGSSWWLGTSSNWQNPNMAEQAGNPTTNWVTGGISSLRKEETVSSVVCNTCYITHHPPGWAPYPRPVIPTIFQDKSLVQDLSYQPYFKRSPREERRAPVYEVLWQIKETQHM